MFEYLRRLATTGAAYTASSVLSKLVAVVLLPIYTAYLSPADYGAAEVMLASLVAASILVRLGLIEALLRFYYLAGEDPRRVVATSFAALLWTATAGAAVGLALAEPISEALLDRPDPELARLAVLGLWVLTLWEYALTLLRLDERARAYFNLTVLNVLATIPVTVWLVAVEDQGAAGILLGSFGTGLLFLAWRLWRERRRLTFVPELSLLRRMIRFGLPTMPAELSLYSLSFIDRILIVRLAGLAEAGLYALAIKFAQGMNVLARGFQLAFPPLAYSIADDDEARRAYSLIVTWFAAVCAFFVAGLWLLARWIVDLLAAPEFFDAYEAIGLLATGIALYSLYLVLVVVLGRTGRTEFNLPATLAGTVANVVLNLALDPAAGNRRRRDRARRLLRAGPGPDVRAHAAPVPGALRVGTACAAGRDHSGDRRCRGAAPAGRMGWRAWRHVRPSGWQCRRCFSPSAFSAQPSVTACGRGCARLRSASGSRRSPPGHHRASPNASSRRATHRR